MSIRRKREAIDLAEITINEFAKLPPMGQLYFVNRLSENLLGFGYTDKEGLEEEREETRRKIRT